MTLPFLSYGGSSILSSSIPCRFNTKFLQGERFKFMKITISTGGTGGHVIPSFFMII